MKPILLLVDDEPSAIHELARCLEGLGDLRAATSGEQALNLARRDPPTLMLLDANMTGLSGLETCRAFKSDPALADIPVIFVTGEEGPEREADGFAAGAADYITKPIHPVVVRARVQTQLRLHDLTQDLRRLAQEDGLTGLSNRRSFEPQLARELALSARSGLPVAVMMVDIDHFKRFNDSAGHAAGDEALKAVAGALARAARRPADLVARWGGEEFVMLLPQTSVQVATTVAERSLAAVAALNLPHPGLSSEQRVSISVGLSAWEPGAPTARPLEATALLDAADQALYQAKHWGRNRACALALNQPPESAQTVATGPSAALGAA